MDLAQIPLAGFLLECRHGKEDELTWWAWVGKFRNASTEFYTRYNRATFVFPSELSEPSYTQLAVRDTTLQGRHYDAKLIDLLIW